MNKKLSEGTIEIQGTCGKVPFYFRASEHGWVFGASRTVSPKAVAYGYGSDYYPAGVHIMRRGKEVLSLLDVPNVLSKGFAAFEAEVHVNVMALKHSPAIDPDDIQISTTSF